MKLTCSKESFLANSANKQRIIIEIGTALTCENCTVVHCTGDADVTIARTVVTMSAQSPTVVEGEDTDLLVLLLFWYVCDDNHFYIVFRSDHTD